jgi:hypothetical protein
VVGVAGKRKPDETLYTFSLIGTSARGASVVSGEFLRVVQTVLNNGIRLVILPGARFTQALDGTRPLGTASISFCRRIRRSPVHGRIPNAGKLAIRHAGAATVRASRPSIRESSAATWTRKLPALPIRIRSPAPCLIPCTPKKTVGAKFGRLRLSAHATDIGFGEIIALEEQGFA